MSVLSPRTAMIDRHSLACLVVLAVVPTPDLRCQRGSPLGYEIRWTGSKTGSAPTTEPSRTPQATREAYAAMFGTPLPICGGSPYTCAAPIPLCVIIATGSFPAVSSTGSWIEYGNNCGLVKGSGTWDVVPTAPASYRAFGTGCAGSAGTPRLAACAGSLPIVGRTFCAELTNLPTALSDPAFMLLGVTRPPTPVPLASIGMPGCTLDIDPLVAEALTKVGGIARWSVAIPNDPALLAAEFFDQGVVFDRNPPANALGVIMSNAAQGTVGAP
jgi:hypothetical protein